MTHNEIIITDVKSSKFEGHTWQSTTVEGVHVSRSLNPYGIPCYEAESWSIEQEAELLLNSRDGGDRVWDDGRHTDEIVAMADQLRAAWDAHDEAVATDLNKTAPLADAKTAFDHLL